MMSVIVRPELVIYTLDNIWVFYRVGKFIDTMFTTHAGNVVYFRYYACIETSRYPYYCAYDRETNANL